MTLRLDPFEAGALLRVYTNGSWRAARLCCVLVRVGYPFAYDSQLTPARGFPSSQLASRLSRQVPDVVQLESHPYCSNTILVDLWRAGGVATLQAYAPFASGRLPVLTDPVVCAVAAAHSCADLAHANCTPAQVVLAWLGHRHLVPVVKASSTPHVAEALAARAFGTGYLSSEELAALDALDRGDSVAFDARLIA